MKHLFAPYELALLAKENGFNEACLAEYVDKNLKSHQSGIESPFKNSFHNNQKGEVFSAPIYQQLVDFFRERNIRVLENPTGTWTIWIGEGDPEAYSVYPDITTALTEAFKLINQ